MWKATTSTTSTASPGTTASGRSWPRAASRWPRASPATTRRPRRCAAWATGRTPSSPPCCTMRESSPYPGSVELLDYLAERGTRMAVVSSSRNTPPVLEAAGLAGRFRVVVDGNVAAREQLSGKPAPDTFAYAAAQLGVPNERAVVFEDALSGVAAGRAGGFGLVVGVDRGVGADRLTESGADLVVTDLAELVAVMATVGDDPIEAHDPLDRMPVPDRRVGASSRPSTATTTWASPRACSRSATATSGCAATSRRAGRPTATAPSSTASTRSGRSGMRRRRSGSPAPGRPSSTSPTTRP